MRSGYALSNRLLALALAFVLILGMLPVGQIAATSTEFGNVSALTAGTVSGSGTANAAVTVSSATLEWSAADSDVGRNQEGWWLGILVNAPENADLSLAQYKQFDGAVQSFQANKDTETGIQLWGLVNEAYLEQFIAEGRNMNYTWLFDWDGNNEFEQTVTITVVPGGITLNKDGAQVYPVPLVGYGAVSELTAGTVSGSATEASVVTVSSATLEWSAADSDVGRNQEGWWLGLMVEAPAAADLSKVMYLSSGSATPKSFLENKDTERGMQLWGLVNQSSLDSFKAKGTNMNYVWQFDWNGDGKYEQTVTLSVDPNSIILKQGGAQVYPALGAVSTYTGGTVTGSKTANVEVLIEEVALNYTNGGGTDAWWVGIKAEAPTYLSSAILQGAKYQTKNGPASDWSAEKNFWSNKDSAGTEAAQYIQLWFPLTPETLAKFQAENRNITMWYRFDWDGNGEYDQSITFSVVPSDKIVLNPAEQAGFGFGAEKSGTVTYEKDKIVKLEASGALSGANVIYEIIEQNPLAGEAVAELTEGGLKILNAGTVIVKATSPAGGIYAEATDIYTLTVEPAPFTVTVNDASRIYGDADPEFTYILDKTLPEDAGLSVTLERVKGVAVGTYEIGAKVTVSANYVCTAVNKGTLTVNQRPITITANNAEKIYGEADPAFAYILSSGTLAAGDVLAVTYTRDAGGNIGAYTIKPGAVVYNSGENVTENYAITLVSGILTINQRAITVTVDNATKNYGVWLDPEFTANITEGTLAEGEEIAYNLSRDTGDTTGSYVINAAPVITKGEVEITANYDITVVPGALTIGQMSNEEFGAPYTLDPAETNENGWYKTDITIKPDEGYTICDANGNLKQENWVEEKVFSTEGTNDVSFYLRRISDGAVSSLFTIQLSLDKVTPVIDAVKADKSALNTITEMLTFGFFKAPVTILVNASDATSGVGKIVIVYTGNTGEYSTTVASGTQTAESSTAAFTLPENFKGDIKVTVYDRAGNCSVQDCFVDASGNSFTGIVVDNVVPTVSGNSMTFFEPVRIVSNADGKDVSFTAGAVTLSQSDDVKLYCTDDVTVSFTIQEENFYAEDVSVQVNGIDAVVTWGEPSGNGEVVGTLTITGEGEHVVTIDYMDKSENAMARYESQTIVIDETDPVIESVEYSNRDVKQTVDDRDYFDAAQSVTIRIRETNFRTDDVQILVVAQDQKGKDVLELAENGYVKSCQEQSVDRGAWKNVGDNTYELVLTFDQDANYELTVSYTDLAQHSITSEKKLFTVDETDPELSVTCAENAIFHIIDEITFGFFKNPVTVQIDTSDITAGVDYITYSYTGNTGMYSVTPAGIEDQPVEGETASFTLPAAFMGSILVNVYDQAGNCTTQNVLVDASGNELEIIVIDNISPERSVSFSTPTKILSNVDLSDVTQNYENQRNFKDGEVVVAEDDNVILYYTNDAIVYIAIQEENFYEEDLILKVNGEETDIDWGVLYDSGTIIGSLELTEGDYVVTMEYTDKSGNEMKVYTSQRIIVDKSAPKITLSYGKEVQPFQTIEGRCYYGAPQTVTVTIYDTIFRPEDVQILVEALDSAGDSLLATQENGNIAVSYLEQGQKWGSWTPGTWYSEDNTYVMELVFDAEANYELMATYTDPAGRPAEVEVPFLFTVDTIAPERNVTFNEPVQVLDNVHYYNGEIQVTIQITEANFYADEVNVTVTKDGAPYNVFIPWADNTVDLHTGSFTVTEDGDYFITVTYTDRSGNVMQEYTSAQLTIDTQAPVVEVTGLDHQSANNGETLSLTVTVTDTNIEMENIKSILTAVIKKETGVNTYTFETVEIELGEAVESVNANGETVFTFTVENLEIDGYYSLICQAVDNANHVTTQIRATDGNGNTVPVETMNFSVNREGSVFWIETKHNDKYTGEIFQNQLDNAYVNDMVTVRVHEINVDKVNEDVEKGTVLTLNNGSTSEEIVLVENDNYEKNSSVGQGGWYESVYTLDNSVFEEDGSYSFNIISYDAANNSNVNTKSETGMISFIVDRTAPVVSANIRNNQRIDAEQYTVEFKITDANLDTSTVVVTFNGETVVPEELGNNEYAFVIGEGLNHTVQITATDKAGNVAELYSVERLTVSTNFFVRWYANSLAFWGALGGVGGGGLLLILFLLLKKKKAA